MRLHLGRTVLVAIALGELGAVAGVLLCWVALVGWMLAHAGPRPPGPFDWRPLLDALMWAAVVGGPVGALALPLLGFTLLRRTPLHRALGLPVLGTLLGLAAAMLLVNGLVMWPVPLLIPGLGLGGLLAGAAVARTWRLPTAERDELPR